MLPVGSFPRFLHTLPLSCVSYGNAHLLLTGENWFEMRALSHDTNLHTAARLPCAGIGERDIFSVLAFLTARTFFLRSSTISIFWRTAPGVLLEFKLGNLNFILILCRIRLWKFYVVTFMSVLFVNITLLGFSLALLSITALVGLTSLSSSELCTGVICFESSPAEGEKAHHTGAVELFPSESLSLLHLLMRVSSGFLKDMNFLSEQLNRVCIVAPLCFFLSQWHLPHQHSTMDITVRKSTLFSNRAAQVIARRKLNLTVCRGH